MDNRTLESGASATPPTVPATPSVGFPQKGNPATGTPASKGGVFWYYQIGEELRNLLLAAGLTPSTGDLTQVTQAVEELIEARAGNYALDTGVANAYVIALSPAITAYTNGLQVRFRAVHANTGAATLNAGGGAIALLNDVGGALVSGDLPAGSVVSAVYDSTANAFLINSLVPSQAISQAQADSRYSSDTFNISGSATGGILNLVLAAPCVINTQSSGGAGGAITQHSIAANLSLAIPALASLGAPTGIRSRFYVAYSAQNNCLMVGNASGVANPETTVVTPTAISGTATAPNIWYTAAGTVATDAKILGYFDATWTSGSGWAIGSTVWAAPGSAMSAQLFARNCNGGMFNSAAQTFSASSYVKVNLDSSTNVSGALIDTTNHQMVVQEDGQYLVLAAATLTPISGATGYLQPFKNGVGMGIVGEVSGTVTDGCAVHGVFNLLAGDVIDLRINNATNNVVSIADGVQLSLVRIGK